MFLKSVEYERVYANDPPYKVILTFVDENGNERTSILWAYSGEEVIAIQTIVAPLK